MAEALALSASIVAVVQIAGQVANICKAYIEGVANYPRDLRVILIETSSLKVLLENLTFLVENDDNSATLLSSLGGENGPIEGCRQATLELENLFPSEQLQTYRQGGRRNRARLSLAVLAWPFREQQARALLGQLVQHKTSISLAVSAESLRDLRGIGRNLSDVTRSLSDTQLRGVFTWLQQTDPSPIHNQAVSDYEEGTGDWVLRTPHWRSWIIGHPRSRCLWIRGIPGAGKTVLAAHLIQRLSSDCGASERQRWACVYYYCHHMHNQDEAIPFLRWLLCQLSRQVRRVPGNVQILFNQGVQPGRADLLQDLESVLQLFDKVFVVVDALDESQPSENLLAILQIIANDYVRFGKIKLLATSREYVGIERVMTRISTPLSMSNSFVAEDIRRYVAARVQSSTVFQRWPEELRTEIEEALSSGASGMFRWAVCQLDILRRLRHQTRVREAIRNPPETLDETYERIYSYIRREDRELVRHCLRWIMLHNTIWASEVNISATILLRTYKQCFPEAAITEAFISDLEIIKDSCGCLLSYDADNVTLAHYTVREFLESERARLGHSAFFAIEANDTFEDLATIMFETALQADIDESADDQYYLDGMKDDIARYCMLSSLQAVYNVRDINVRPDLAIDFMDPSKTHLRRFLNSMMSCSIPWPNGFSLLWQSIQSLIDLNLELDPNIDPNLFILINLLWVNRLDLAAELLLHRVTLQEIWTESLSAVLLFPVWNWSSNNEIMPRSPRISGNIVDLIAVSSGEIGSEALSFLLDHARDFFDPTKALLYYMGGHQHHSNTCIDDCPLRKLLRMGADPNSRGSPCTPLQIAILGRDVSGIQVLLEAGADPLSSGDAGVANWPPAEHVMGPFAVLRGQMPLEIIDCLDRISFTGNGDPEEQDELEEQANSLLQAAVDLRNNS